MSSKYHYRIPETYHSVTNRPSRSGKSVFAATLADQLASPGVPVLHFFFRQIIEANHRPINLLRDWLSQILEYSPPLQTILKEHIEHGRSLGSFSHDDFWLLLKTAMAHVPKVFCVVDAIDEMDADCLPFLESLTSLGKWRPSKVKILATSRPNANLEPFLRSTSLKTDLWADMVDLDIATYVAARLADSDIPQSDCETIKEAVPGRANGLFLYARLALDAFLQPGAVVAEVIESLPLDLNMLYAKLLNEHSNRSGTHPETQLTILKWVTHATRPLRLLELADLLAHTTPLNTDTDIKSYKQLVRDACGPLLDVLPDETISVVHHTLTEFLLGGTRSDGDATGYPVLDSNTTHRHLAIMCIRYVKIAYQDIMDDPDSAPATYESTFYLGRCMERPCLAYASENWDKHKKRATSLETPIDISLLEDVKQVFGNRIIASLWMSHRLSNGKGTVALSALSSQSIHVSAYCGLTTWLRQCLQDDDPPEANVIDHFGMTPLLWAAEAGELEAVNILLEAGANSEAYDRKGLASLHRAASNNHHQVVARLLEVGVNPYMAKDENTTKSSYAFNVACRKDHLETVEVLLKAINLDAKHEGLGEAATSGADSVVKRLLQGTGININRRLLKSLNTPLIQATSEGRVTVMRRLLEAGAHPNIAGLTRRRSASSRNPDFKDLLTRPTVHTTLVNTTALHELCLFSLPSASVRKTMEMEYIFEAFHLLVDAGADLNAKNHRGETPLHVCQSPVLLKLLLEAGATPHLGPYFSQRPNALDEDSDILKLLLEAGADVQETYHSKSVLMLSTSNTVKFDMFLSHGCDPSLRSDQGQTVLHIAAKAMSPNLPDVISKLLAYGIDVNIRDKNGNTPLHLSLQGIHHVTSEMVDILLGAGADPNARNLAGRTPAMEVVAAPHGNELKIELLTKLKNHGAEFEVKDAEGRSILRQACLSAVITLRNGRSKELTVWDYLLSHGVDPLAFDNEGNSVLQQILNEIRAGPGSPEAVVIHVCDLLKDCGVDPSWTNLEGRSLLHQECKRKSTTPEPARMTHRILDWLRLQNVDMDLPDNRNIRPVHLAAGNSFAILQKLIDQGVSIGALTSMSESVLHYAARNRNWSSVGLLVTHLKENDPDLLQALLNTKSSRGFTPIHYICRASRPEILDLLLSAGVKIQDLDLTNLSPRKKFPWTHPIFQCALTELEWRTAESPIEMDDDQKPSTKIPTSFQKQLRRDMVTKIAGLRGYDARMHDEVYDVFISEGVDPCDMHNAGDVPFLEVIDACASAGEDCAVDSLLRLRQRVHGAGSYPKANWSLAVKVSQARWRAERETILSCASSQDPLLVVTNLIRLRHFDAIKDLHSQGVDFTRPGSDGNCILHFLAARNLWNLLNHCCTAKEAKLFDDWRWRAAMESKHGCDTGTIRPLLLTACENTVPSMRTIQVLVENKEVDVNAAIWLPGPVTRKLKLDIHGWSALHFLASGKSWWQASEALPYLVSKGAAIGVQDRMGVAPLHLALRRNCLRIPLAAPVLIEWGADVNITDEKGSSCLSYADADVNLTRLLLSHGAKVDLLAINAAASAQDLQILEPLLLANAKASDSDAWRRDLLKPGNATQESNQGQHPLFTGACFALNYKARWATLDGANQTVRLLLENGFRLDDRIYTRCGCRDPYEQQRPLRVAPHQKVQKLWEHAMATNGFQKFRAERTSSGTELYLETTVLHSLLQRGGAWAEIFAGDSIPHLELRDARGCTPFITACGATEYTSRNSNDDTGLVRRLLECGVDVYAKDKFGMNALHHLMGKTAIIKDRMRVIEILGDLILPLSIEKDEKGYFPLHYAVSKCWGEDGIEQLEKLFSSGVSPYILDAEGNHILHHLVPKFGQGSQTPKVFSFFKSLVGLGIDINAPNTAGETALHMFWRCASNNHAPADSMVKFLDEVGANWRARSYDGSTLLHEIARGADADAFELVWFKGADPFLEDAEGKTALDVAMVYGKEKILDLFQESATSGG